MHNSNHKKKIFSAIKVYKTHLPNDRFPLPSTINIISYPSNDSLTRSPIRVNFLKSNGVFSTGAISPTQKKAGLFREAIDRKIIIHL
jgi:hypothetical protein